MSINRTESLLKNAEISHYKKVYKKGALLKNYYSERK